MSDIVSNSVYFGVVISILAYAIGCYIKNKLKWAIANPLLISVIIIIAVLVIFKVDYDTYNEGAKYLSYLLTPATVCLAIPLYEQLDKLKENLVAIIVGIFSGVITSLTAILILSKVFGLTHEQYVTLLPKSITTAIGIGVSEELGGIIAITATAIICTGIFGNMIAEVVCKVFRITDPVARGIGIGTSAHVIGTVKAMEMGEVEGAMSSLSIAVSGLLTVMVASVYACFL